MFSVWLQFVASKCKSYPKDRLYKIISQSQTSKARLLHYFPPVPQKSDDKTKKEEKKELTEDELGNWCGWHNDHGSLTALVPSMYIDKDGKEVPNPDPKCGLWIKNRAGKLIQGKLQADCMAFQIGETEQIHSGGILQATPHCVMVSDPFF
jgi:isopenicillin N synthase-like dioxygenase